MLSIVANYNRVCVLHALCIIIYCVCVASSIYGASKYI